MTHTHAHTHTRTHKRTYAHLSQFEKCLGRHLHTRVNKTIQTYARAHTHILSSSFSRTHTHEYSHNLTRACTRKRGSANSSLLQSHVHSRTYTRTHTSHTTHHTSRTTHTHALRRHPRTRVIVFSKQRRIVNSFTFGNMKGGMVPLRKPGNWATFLKSFMITPVLCASNTCFHRQEDHT